MSINRRYPIAIIHAQDTGYSGLAAVIAARILKIPVIISSHGIRHKVIQSYVKGRFKKVLHKIEYALDMFTVKRADMVMVDNPSIKNYYQEKVSTKIDYIPVPIKIDRFRFSEQYRESVRRELGISKEMHVVGFVGRLVPVKNLFALLSSFANIVENNPSVRLVLVGTGFLEPELKNYVYGRNIANYVIFSGVRYDINRVLSSFDIFVLPSFTEGLAISLLEAMACGVPVICSDIPANRVLVTNREDGLTFDPHKPQELEACMLSLLHDKELRARLRDNALLKVVQYDEGIVFPKILKYYDELLK